MYALAQLPATAPFHLNDSHALQHTIMATRPNAAATSQALTLLGQFTDSIDSLPHDLTKAFGDLRELDAVLRSSMQGITSKVHKLIDLMQDPSATPAARLCLLLEIAEDAQRLRMGSEDKIRVAGRTADDVAAHNQHNHQILNHLSELDPSFEEALYIRRTNFPHVAPANLLPPTGEYALGPNGRRRRVPTGGVAQSSVSIGARISAPMAVSASTGGDKNKRNRLEAEEPRRTPLKGKEKDQRMAAEKERETAADSRKPKKPYVDIPYHGKEFFMTTILTDGHKGRNLLTIPHTVTEIATLTNNIHRLRQMATHTTSHKVITITPTTITAIRIRTTGRPHIFHRPRIIMVTPNLNHLTLLLVPIHHTHCRLMIPNIRSNQQEHRLSLTSSRTAVPLRTITHTPTIYLLHLNLETTNRIHVVQVAMACEPPEAAGAEAATRMEVVTAQLQKIICQDVGLRATRHPASYQAMAM
ncbi:hypothetical protein FRC01_005178 [Tulasnella sp. 417]|nr:hypothetical protein FRC01_005178 [Tulasnella sp. 417]